MTASISEPAKTEPTRQGALKVLTNPRYALYFGGQLISQSGTWMQMVATSWLAYKLTGSAFLLAAVGMSAQLPALIVMPVAGVLIDRFNRHKVVLITQVIAMIQAAVLAALTMTHTLQLWHLIALGVWSGLVSGFDMPSRSAFVVGLVDSKKDLPAAIALNSTLMNATRMIGPALAGFIVAGAGEGMCFLINALSYIAVIAALFFIRGDFTPPKASKTASVGAELVDGLKYVWDTIPLRALILMMAFYCLGAMAYASIMPVFVTEIHGDAKTLGFLMSSSAVGSLVGAILLANRKHVLGLGGWIAGAAFAFSAALFVFARITSFWPAVAVLVFMGFCMMIQIAGTNTLIQSLVHDSKRGRVMSLFSMAFMGTAPIGSLICGALINQYGFSWTICGCAAYCTLVAAVWALYLPRLRVSSRPLYIEKGLIIAEQEVSKME